MVKMMLCLAVSAFLVVVAAVSLGLLAIGCSGDDAAGKTTARKSGAPCPVTLPNNKPVPTVDAGVNHGNGSVWVSLSDGGKVVVPQKDVNPDGSIDVKFAWWRGIEGQLSIEGRKLGASSRPPHVRIPEGYGPRGIPSNYRYLSQRWLLGSHRAGS
jgi:hypothetical protein